MSLRVKDKLIAIISIFYCTLIPCKYYAARSETALPYLELRLYLNIGCRSFIQYFDINFSERIAGHPKTQPGRRTKSFTTRGEEHNRP